MMLAVAAGCSDGPAREPAGALPGASPLALRSNGAAASEERACGYDEIQDTGPGLGFPGHHDVFHGRYGYNAAGLEILDEAVDAKGGFARRTVIEYTAMGKPSRYVDSYVDFPDTTMWLAYDSFGRRIRVSSDYEGDGVEDVVITYGYTTGDQPTTRSLRSPPPSQHHDNYDRSFHYDTLGRMTSYDQDDDLDGTADQIATIVYDEDARVRTTTVRDTAGTIASTIEEAFDEFNHQLSWVRTAHDPDTGRIEVYEQRLTYDGDRLVHWADTTTSPDGVPDFAFSRSIDYHYSGCH
jgi:hypothetical protein